MEVRPCTIIDDPIRLLLKSNREKKVERRRRKKKEGQRKSR